MAKSGVKLGPARTACVAVDGILETLGCGLRAMDFEHGNTQLSTGSRDRPIETAISAHTRSR